MKLNYKRTLLVGFAFFLICAFWQAYDKVVPLILTNKFQMNQTLSGFIMSLDNIFAIFMLPLFGALSDRTKTKFGRRTPYIVLGTIAAAVALCVLGIVPSLAGFILVLLLCLVSMATFRSPAVALMPDVTVKPLRSKANAIINLMGTAGGIVVLGLGIVFKTGVAGKTDFSAYLLAVAILMFASLAVFLLTVKEPAWAAEASAADEPQTQEADAPHEKMAPDKFLSLFFLLASVVLWFFGYNSVTSKYSVYASNVLHMDYDVTLLVAQGAAIAAYIPVGLLASKFGRKKTILLGIVLLSGSFTAASFVTEGTSAVLMYILFALAGIGWATINVNSFPMVVELSSHADIGKYTGYYYTASMAAQVVTPIFSGFLYETLGWWVFFPYAAVFSALALVTMLFVRHGDCVPERNAAIMESVSGGED